MTLPVRPLCRLSLGLFLLLLGCVGGDIDDSCSRLCDELYTTCSYSAFPDHDSCMEGCRYSEEEGADVDAQLDCVRGVECDVFAVIECENTYGVGTDD